MRELINPIWMKNSVAFVVQKHKIPVSKSQITKDGRNIIVTGNPIFDEHHNIKKIIINVRDITEIYKLREELIESRKREFRYFENILDNDHSKEFSSSTVVVSPAIQEAFSMASKVGKFDATVLITGESGSGKEEVAKHIHANSMRKDKPFITINCGAIPDNLLESELFGYVKGAFTGANHSGKKGLLEVADTGTVFLDEVGELPLSFQVKLLRTIENKEIIRVGDVKATPIDVRFIAATNCDLQTMLERGEFREDLYYRLNVVHIVVPPLKQRKEDILPLCIYFLKIFNAKYSQHKRLSDEVIKMMETYLWPGNVRELRNLIERMVVMSSNEYLQVSDLPWSEEKIKLLLKKRAIPSLVKAEGYNFEEEISRYEKELLLQAKQKYATTREIGKYLHIDQSTVVRKMKKYGI